MHVNIDPATRIALNARENLDPIVRIALADPILSKKQTAMFAGFSVSTMERQMKRGLFPKPTRLSDRRVGWPLSALQAWRASRTA